MALLIPDEKLLIKIIFWPVQKATGYRPGPVAPPTADGSSFPNKCREKDHSRAICTSIQSKRKVSE